MTEKEIEEIVEETMRCYHMGSYKDYSNEELREKYRQMIREDKPIERIENNGCCENI